MDNFGFNDFLDLDNEYKDIVEGRDWMDCPEQRLIWAVIERSVRDALGNQVSDAITALDWFFKPELSAAEIFSFQWCCETLSIDAKELQQKILKMREQLHKFPVKPPYECTQKVAA